MAIGHCAQVAANYAHANVPLEHARLFNEGMRAAFTDAPRMPLALIASVLLGFACLALGLRNSRRRVLS